MTITNKDLKRKIIEISYKHTLSHLGSCLTAVDIIDEIYANKKPEEKFVLSSGHAGLALYVVLEKYEKINAEKIFNHHGVHPDFCSSCHLHCSTGSLGQGLPIALGMALSNRSQDVYCLISDGECSEGSIHEALRVMTEQKVSNLKVYVNYNGFAAYKNVYSLFIAYPIGHVLHIRETNVEQFSFLKGIDAHYYIMNEEDYKLALKLLE
jgi:transketolase